ncbi:hypothetical protein EYF80_031282 [Liparis tanakae]|uniref:Uncharacterized protein n=1 Tax=Liparis tanakae TaxID=230148 RepID=A0A4Z2GYF1_9TELE|nr:hypothetical protein EYF80_031282 [Liparis tanakae]
MDEQPAAESSRPASCGCCRPWRGESSPPAAPEEWPGDRERLSSDIPDIPGLRSTSDMLCSSLDIFLDTHKAPRCAEDARLHECLSAPPTRRDVHIAL